MTSPGVATAPPSHQVSRRWSGALESVADSWPGSLHLGVLRAHSGDLAGARAAWTRSIALEPTAWAWRNLAALAAATGDRPGTLRDYRRAVALRPDLAPLRLELVTILLADGQGHRSDGGDRGHRGHRGHRGGAPGAARPGPLPLGRGTSRSPRRQAGPGRLDHPRWHRRG